MTAGLALDAVTWIGGAYLAALTVISVVGPLRVAALPLPMLAAAAAGLAPMAWPWPALAALAAAAAAALGQRRSVAGPAEGDRRAGGTGGREDGSAVA